MPKYYKWKDRNPNDPDISIWTQHRQNRIFMHNILRKYSNHQIFKYSNKHKNLKEQRKIQQIPWNEKICAKNAKKLEKNPWQKHTTWHDKLIKMQRCANGKERDASLKLVEIPSECVT
jgi:hypothetical protein